VNVFDEVLDGDTGSSIFSFLGTLFAADGGYITGPGSSRSDNIPAMISNGEFVVNAASTAKHRALLEAINLGTIPYFADGGIVGSYDALKPAIRSEDKNTNNTSVFNINITGDISSQTRKQVLSMIPEIAAGTNAHNREINYNRR
jgi:hypothetical protein